MGGWIQYSLGPTVSAWLAQHFWLHWRYSNDRDFLEERAYPYVEGRGRVSRQYRRAAPGRQEEAAAELEPEINDNRIDAWFNETTNFDLALIRWLYGAAAVMADELGLAGESGKVADDPWRMARHWPWPETTGGCSSRRAIRSRNRTGIFRTSWPSIRLGSSIGTGERPTGGRSARRSPSSTASARTGGAVTPTAGWGTWRREPSTARRPLKPCGRSPTVFCLPNSFHANGDQTKSGKSKMTYRPFTLEGNFAFAAGIQEMLLQSHAGVVRVFPAVPASLGGGVVRLSLGRRRLSSSRRQRGTARSSRSGSARKTAAGFGSRIPFRDRAYEATGVAAAGVRNAGPIIEADIPPGGELRLKGR